MSTCAGCGTEFDESVELFPRLVISKEVQVARRLAEREDEEDMLCLGCWLDAVNGLDKRQLAMLLLGMLKKINGLEEELENRWYRTQPPDLIEKMKKRYPAPNTQPKYDQIWVAPNTQPYDRIYVGDPPYPTSHTARSQPSCRFTSLPDDKNNMYLSGTWAEKVQ